MQANVAEEERVHIVEAEINPAAAESVNQRVLGKKWKRDRRTALLKTELCRHVDSPEGCPHKDCSFAHGLDELRDGGETSMKEQRLAMRELVENRQVGKFEENAGLENNTEEKEDTSTFKAGAVTDRYYTKMFQLDVMGKEGEDQFVNLHSNRLCVIGVAPGHRIFKEKLEPVEVSFDVGKNGTSLLQNKVHGKRKKGGMWFQPDTPVCKITCSNGESFLLRSNIRASLLELNENLVKHPSLLSDCYASGYIAIVRPKVPEISAICASLVPASQYQKLRQVV